MSKGEGILSVEGASLSTPDGRLLIPRLDFEVRTGEILWIRGPNGVGKSSLLAKILGLCARGGGPLGRGNVRVGVAPEDVLALSQSAAPESLWPLRLRDIFAILGGAHVDAFRELLPARLDAVWDSASGGERQRTLLAALLSRRPRLLVLDEPTNHLDTESRRRIWEALRADFTKPQTPHAALLVSHEDPRPFLEGVTVRLLELGEGASA